MRDGFQHEEQFIRTEAKLFLINALANYFAALQAGVTRFETALGGLGGQPANIVDRVPVRGTGDYCVTASQTGLVSTEDFLAVLEGMNIETGGRPG